MEQMTERVEQSLSRLKSWVEKEEYRGWDPYDGLTSRVFQSLPGIRDVRFFRLAWIQLFKRNPVNLRKIFLISKDYNPKGVGLFLNGYCYLYRLNAKPEYLEKIRQLADKVLELTSKGYSGACWGYNFDWESRAFFQPAYTPTIVASVFVGYALLDAYEILEDSRLLEEAVSVSDFLLKDLNRTYDEEGDFSFSYSPLDHSQVYNATLLGSRMLARLYRITGDERMLREATHSVDYVVKAQREDGSWSYSPLPFHQWIDNFHTGYNLECLWEYQKYAGTQKYAEVIERGFDYYIRTFFEAGGRCRYYNDSLYPIDIHAPAQLIITLSRLKRFAEHRDLADSVIGWTIDHMQDPEGYFYFQIKKAFTSRIPYMRWAQGWMFLAMSIYLTEAEKTTMNSGTGG